MITIANHRVATSELEPRPFIAFDLHGGLPNHGIGID